MSTKKDNTSIVSEGDSSSMLNFNFRGPSAFSTSHVNHANGPQSQQAAHTPQSEQDTIEPGSLSPTHNNERLDPHIKGNDAFLTQGLHPDAQHQAPFVNGQAHGSFAGADHTTPQHAHRQAYASPQGVNAAPTTPYGYIPPKHPTQRPAMARHHSCPSVSPQQLQGQQSGPYYNFGGLPLVDQGCPPPLANNLGLPDSNQHDDHLMGPVSPEDLDVDDFDFSPLSAQQAINPSQRPYPLSTSQNDHAGCHQHSHGGSRSAQAIRQQTPISAMGQQTQHDNDSYPHDPYFIEPDDEANSKRPQQATGPSRPCQEQNCKRKYREGSTLWDQSTQRHIQFCKRHQDKWKRNNAPSPVFTYFPNIHSFHEARKVVYPEFNPLDLEGDDVHNEDFYRDHWVRRFIDAANQPYTNDYSNDYHDFLLRQQKVFNGKGFNNETVNVRMRFLYQAAYVLHAGGQQVYPDGGDNGGYGRTDKSLRFSDRLIRLIDILSRDKRVCMDVIEGRGVTAFVCNPEKYEKRKTQNKDSNERKQKKQMLGDRVQEKRAAKGKDRDRDEVDTDDYSGEESDFDSEEDAHTAPEIYGTPLSMATASEVMAGAQGSLGMPPAPNLKRKRETKSATPRPARSTRSKKAKRAADAAQQHDLSSSALMNPAQSSPATDDVGGFASKLNDPKIGLHDCGTLHEFDANAAQHRVTSIGAMTNPAQPPTADDSADSFAAGTNGHDEGLHDASEFQRFDANAEDEAAALRSQQFDILDWVNDS